MPSAKVRADGGLYDLHLPEVQPGDEPLPHSAPSPAALANHIRLLLRSRRKLTPEERAARKNHEPFCM